MATLPFGTETQKLIEAQKKKLLTPSGDQLNQQAALEAERRAREQVASQAQGQRQSFLRDMASRGMGGSGAAGLSAQRANPAIAQAMQQAGSQARVDEESRQQALLSQLTGQQLSQEQATQQAKESEHGMLMDDEQLSLAKQQFSESKNQFAQQYSLERDKFDQAQNEFDQQLEWAKDQFNKGQIHEKEMQELQQGFQANMAKLEMQQQSLMQLKDQAFQSGENALDRAQKDALTKLELDTQARIAKSQSKWGAFGSIFGGIAGAAGSMLGKK